MERQVEKERKLSKTETSGNFKYSSPEVDHLSLSHSNNGVEILH